MFRSLLLSQHLRRRSAIVIVQNFKRCDLLQPMSPNMKTASSNPCGCGTTSQSSSGPTGTSGPCGGGTSGGTGGGSGRSSASGGSKSRHHITYMPYQPLPPKQHDYKNMDLGRPMSPHLTIYAPTIPATTSIFQRITGIILVFYAVMLSGGSLFLSNGVETYVSMIQSLDLNRLSILIIKFILGIPFAFHYTNGIRFCLWNAAKHMAMKDVLESARKCVIITAVIAVLFALI